MTIILIIVAVILFIVFLRILKIPKFGNMVLVTGGVKTGKTTMSVHLAYRQYRRAVRGYYIYNYFLYPCFHWLPFKKCKAMKKKEKPLFYSNVPVRIKGYVPITFDLLERTKRFRYGSVIYLCETSIVCDSQCIKEPLLNERMLLLCKLIAHETKGGYLFLDTQALSDNHYAVKRTVSTYFYIHHTLKIFPFFVLCWVRELKYSDDNNVVNNFDDDVEKTLQLVFVPKSTWKKFDRYCYSVLTDDLPVVDQTVDPKDLKDLKARKIVSFRDYQSIPQKYLDNERTKRNEKSEK